MRVNPSIPPRRAMRATPVRPQTIQLRATAPVPVPNSPVRPAPVAETAPAPQGSGMPAWFALEPTSISLPDTHTALRELGRGRPFPAAIAAQFAKIVGQTITPEGLEKLYEPLLPNCVWVVSDPQLDSGNSSSREATDSQAKGANFIISAIDRNGRIVFESGVAMCRHADGSLEVNNFDADVAPEYRGQGITARAELLNERLLRALSSHPNSRFSLSAGSAMDGNTGQSQQGTGTLVHAARGYIFADSVGMESYFTDYPTSPLADPAHPEDQATVMAKHFAAWVAQEPTLCVGGKPADAAVRDELAAKAARCRQPWDFLRLASNGVTAMGLTAGGKPGPTDVGPAFLLSGGTPEWRGVRFVNALGIESTPREAQLRHTSQAVFGVQIKREMTASAQRAQHLTEKLWQAIHGGDPAARAAAYLQLGLHGDPGIEPFLRAQLTGRPFKLLPFLHHRAPETDPQVRLALEQALKMLSGALVRPGLAAAMNNTALSQEARNRMDNRLYALNESGRLQASA